MKLINWLAKALKLRGEIQHEDIGQMNLYLNYFKMEENTEGRKSNTHRTMVQRAIRQTPTVNPSAYTTKKEPRNESLTTMGTKLNGRHYRFIG